MRTLLIAGVAGSLLFAGASQSLAQADYPMTRPTPPPSAPPSSSAPPGQAAPPAPLQTPDQAGRANVQSAASAPLHDMNLVRAKIPPVLLAAISDAYARPTPLNCGTITADVSELNDALGPDLDAPPPGERTIGQKSGALSLSLMHTVAEDLLPFNGFVRTLSGAEQHDRLVIQALIAGNARRGYLKGLGEARRCYPPAAPRHLVRAAAPAQDDHAKPKYPIR